MRRLAFLGIACAAVMASFALAQTHPRHAAQYQAMQHQAALMYHAAMHQQAMLRHQQALAAQQAWRIQAAWHAKARQASTVVVRTSTSSSTKKTVAAQPVVVSTEVTSRTRQTPGPANSTLVRTNVKVQTQTSVAGSPGTRFVTRLSETERTNSQRGKYMFKETWTENWRSQTGAGTARSKERVTQTEQVSFQNGKQVIKDNWSTKVSGPAFAYLPLQVQMSQLEYLLPFQPWYYGALPGKASIQTKITWPGGAEKITTKVVDRYDSAGRFLGAQIQVKDTVSGKPALLAALTPQTQLNLLEAASFPGGPYPYGVLDPIAYSWAYPYHPYRYGWTAFDRIAGMPIWW